MPYIGPLNTSGGCPKSDFDFDPLSHHPTTGLRELVLLQTISIFEESVSFDFENASEIFEIGKT